VVALPITTELPAVERTLDRLTNDFTVNTQMRAKVRAEGVMHACFTGLCSVNNEFTIHRTDRLYVAWLKFMASRH
jgi:hypothetical protein